MLMVRLPARERLPGLGETVGVARVVGSADAATEGDYRTAPERSVTLAAKQIALNRPRAYRLVGYENRRLEHRDFNDDTKDAGEIGAGHTVTALYEIVPAGQGVEPKVDALEYQTPDASLTAKAKTGELMTVKLRYKQPSGSKSKLLSVPVRDGDGTLEGSSEDFRFAAAVAELGLLLRGSKWRGKASWSQAYALAEGALGKDLQGRRAEMLELVRQAAALSGETIAMERRGAKVAR